MRAVETIKVNFHGGIISPGELYNILVAVTKAGIRYVSFGLRQQLLITVSTENKAALFAELDQLDIGYETGNDQFPNVMSSYPAEEIFITKTWLSEGVYKDILDAIDYRPQLKINLSDCNQSFTPLLTGNINWVAAPDALHFWHLFIRFPKTNTIYEWTEMVYTNDVAAVSKEIETCILQNKALFIDNAAARGEDLMRLVHKENYNTKPASQPAVLPAFNLPYYEGLNRYNDKYWLGVYRRDELFPIDFLKAVCRLCLDTRIGHLCSTPWKSIIVKGIEEKDKLSWNRVLEKYRVNMRHAANELNFQVEDNCTAGLQLKQHLVKHLNNEDIRTFGLCIGIKTRKKSEVFSSILVRRKPVLNFFGWELGHVYDILCAHDFNPNERTGFVFSSGNPRFLLGEQLRRAIIEFYQNRQSFVANRHKTIEAKEAEIKTPLPEMVHQCKHCYTVYDDTMGEPDRGFAVGTLFEQLPVNYTCSLCEAGREDFVKIDKRSLGLMSV